MGFGAQLTVVGLEQARAYIQTFGKEPIFRASKRSFKFGIVRLAGLRALKVEMPISGLLSFVLSAKIVDVNVPLLLGLGALSEMYAVLEFAKEALVGRFNGWKVPLIRKKG